MVHYVAAMYISLPKPKAKSYVVAIVHTYVYKNRKCYCVCYCVHMYIRQNGLRCTRRQHKDIDFEAMGKVCTRCKDTDLSTFKILHIFS